MTDVTDVNADAQKEIAIQEEYQLWRKNCRYMYEFVSETSLTWPSLTVQWLPDYTEDTTDGIINAKLLLGTHTSGEATNFVKVASTQLPFGQSTKKPTSRLKVTKKLQNNFEINRARFCPQTPNIIASINGSGQVDLHNLESDAEAVHFEPHTENGYGLSWNPHRQGYLLTGSDDHTIVLTDTTSEPKQVFVNKSCGDIVNDTKWHSFDTNVFGAVSDDSYAYIYDIRTPEKPVSRFYSENSQGINSLSFSPFSQYLLAIGNTNSNINLLDSRKLTNGEKSTSGLLHTMMGHSESITSLEFSPFKDGVIASGSQDRRLIIWDLFKIGEEQAQEDAEDGCPELFMMHAGHTGAVTDLSWCPFKDWTIASVAEDNIVHLWEVSKSLLDAELPVSLNASDLE